MQKQALIVDDSRVARLTMSKLLAPYDLDIIQLGSGEEALNYLQTDNVNPDIIFMDVTMGGLDGLETTKLIKQNESLSSIPVVMCTGHDTETDQRNAIAVGAIAALTKPPKEELLAEVMSQLEQKDNVVAELSTPELIAESVLLLDPTAPSVHSVPPTIEVEVPAVDDDALMTKLEQEWLPNIQQKIIGRVEDITRRIAAETANGVVANQIVQLNNAKPTPELPIDNSQLELNIFAKVERELLPNIQQDSREIAEDISRQIILDSMETSISSHLKTLLPSIKEQLKEQIKQSTVEIAQQAAQQMIDQSAESAVQFAIDDSNLAEKATTILDQQGKSWLTEQEQHISLVTSKQVEQNLSPLVAQYLDVNLAERVTSHLAQVEDEESAEIEENEDLNEIAILVDELTRKVSFLKEVVMVLSIVVVGAVGAALLLNAGIL